MALGDERRSMSSVIALVMLAWACSGCPTTLPPRGTSIVEFNRPAYLGPETKVDYLARGFWVSGQKDLGGFGHYVYLLFQPEATREQKLTAAEAFLGYEEYKRFEDQIDRKKLALLVAPINHPESPARAEQLVDDYDKLTAAVVTHEVERVRPRIPPVALVAYPVPIELGTKIEEADLLVTDACGDPRYVLLKFRRMHEALVTGNTPGAVMRLAAALGRVLTPASTSCP
jgi:hypothetical protein